MLKTKIINLILLFTLIGVSIVSCKKDDDNDKLDKTSVFQYGIRLTTKLNAKQLNDYNIDLSNVFFTKMVGITHNSKNKLFREGREASTVLKEFMSDNLSGKYYTSLQALKTNKEASSVFGETKEGEIKNEGFDVDSTRTSLDKGRYLSFISKIKQSPDWFVGINNIDLYKLVSIGNSLTYSLNVYDAGVYNGNAFIKGTELTSPQGEISIMNDKDSPLMVGTTEKIVAEIGYVTIYKIKKIE